MGLVRASPGPMGRDRLCPARHVAPLERDRGVLAESMDQAHLIEAMDGVLRRLGGTPRVWRTDRLATVIRPGAKRRPGDVCPGGQALPSYRRALSARRGNRKGAVEAAVSYTSGRWWRSLGAKSPRRPSSCSTGSSGAPGDAQTTARRLRGEDDGGRTGRRRAVVGSADAPFPATVIVERPVDDNATVAFRGNRYSVQPGLSGTTLELRRRLATSTLQVHAASGALLVSHRLAPSDAGTIVRTRASNGSGVGRPVQLHHGPTLRHQGQSAARSESLAEAARLLGTEGREVTVDLSGYADLVEGIR